MNDKELTHLARQLSRVYGWNKKSNQPCHLSFCNLNPESKTYQICCSKNDGFANYIIEKCWQMETLRVGLSFHAGCN